MEEDDPVKKTILLAESYESILTSFIRYQMLYHHFVITVGILVSFLLLSQP